MDVKRALVTMYMNSGRGITPARLQKVLGVKDLAELSLLVAGSADIDIANGLLYPSRAALREHHEAYRRHCIATSIHGCGDARTPAYLVEETANLAATLEHMGCPPSLSTAFADAAQRELTGADVPAARLFSRMEPASTPLLPRPDSAEEVAASTPLPPEQLVDALQDRVHHETGIGRAAKSVKVPTAAPTTLMSDAEFKAGILGHTTPEGNRTREDIGADIRRGRAAYWEGVARDEEAKRTSAPLPHVDAVGPMTNRGAK